MIDLSKLTDASGKPIDTSKADPAVMAVLSAAFGSLSKAVTEAVTKVVSDTTKPLADKLVETETKLAEFAQTPAPKPGDPAPKGDDESKPPAWFAAYAEKVDKLAGEIEGERTRAGLTQHATAYLEKHMPRLNPAAKKLLVDSIVNAGAQDDEKIKAVIETERARAIAYGADKKNPFGADVAAEGGQAGAPEDQEAKKQAILDELKAEAKQKQL